MADPTFHITTPRLYLHYFIPTNPSHLDFLSQSFAAPTSTTAGQTLSSPIHDRETARADIESRIPDQTTTGFGRYLVSLRHSPNDSFINTDVSKPRTLVGIISMKLRKHPRAPKVPDIGFFFVPEQTGKGYATEAATALLGYFEGRGVRDVLGFCDPQNERSKAMFVRLGWEERGVREVFGLRDRMDDGVDVVLCWVKNGMGEVGEYGV
ncbi:hypothetical protein CC80DRAFT_491570 [Byssothecium circinans]|uniref:N-acetyltransferase domain-containing protein n=1 Tax=Byssothecium circinans TaxID=147558 RepID=A0A6A5TX58_9PLEO|nr:hypothetical protein CC80DRAFT_491570 [Byssothecium circinans]